NVNVLATCFFDRNHVTRLHLIGRNIHFAFVNQHVPVVHKLTSLTTRSRESRAIHAVIEPALKQKQKVLTRDSFLPCGPLEVISKLSFENEVDALNLLLFAELLAVTGERFTAAHGIAMLSGRLRAALFNRTRRFVAAISLEEKFCTFAATQAAHRISI